jgi:lysophospholipase L1-like esterase
VPVLWITAPQIEVGRDEVPQVDEPANDDARIDRYNEILGEVVGRLEREGERVGLVDLEGYLATTPGGPEDEALRPDGVHFSFGTAGIVAEAWLGPEIVVAARQLLAG